MNRYLLNSPVLTAYGSWRYHGPLTLDEARSFVCAGPCTSAIGHAGTAQHLSALLQTEVRCARRAVQMQPGDRALVLQIDHRLPEGQVLDAAALAALPQRFGLLERTA